MSQNFTSRLRYLRHDERFKTEKPYRFKEVMDDHGIATFNMETDDVDHEIIDLRGKEQQFNLVKHGFEVLKLDSPLDYEDYHDPERVHLYFRQVEAALKSKLGAKRVEMFRYEIRKRHPQWPVNIGERYETSQPATGVHIDTSPEEVYQEARRKWGDDVTHLSKARMQWINLWKPLRGPLSDWPLLLCDPATVDKSRDLEPADLIYPTKIAENCMVYHSPAHAWYYLSMQMPDEVWAFVQGDTLTAAPPGVPHCSVPNPFTPVGEKPRESIETRCMAFY